jgi:Aerotolerance regulator N-terminal/von Willebrand factor type A domain
MNFLNPWVAAGLAAVVVPILVIFYFLKLRRREQAISSTFLWKRAVQDLQVNAPFQRLRKNLLLLLQLLVLAAALLALARPIVKTDVAGETSIVLMIDRSASMNTLEGGRSRFELAREQAVRYVKTLNRTSGSWLSMFGAGRTQTRAMLIAFADRASVISPFTTSTTELVSMLEKLEPTDGPTNFREALDLAQAYMQPGRGNVESAPGVVQNPMSAETASRVLLFSDGCIRDVGDVSVHASGISLINVATTSDNVGITGIRTLRNYEKPELLSVFLSVENFGDSPARTDVSLYVDGRLGPGRVESIELGPAPRREPVAAASAPADTPAAPAEDEPRKGNAAQLNFEFPLRESGLIEARLSRDDALAVDNRAAVFVPPARKLRVLTVSEHNTFLAPVLEALPLESCRFVTPEQYTELPAAEVAVEGRSVYDVVIFDKFAPEQTPTGNYLYFGVIPAGLDLVKQEEAENFRLMWWDDTHPVLRYAALDYIDVAKGIKYSAPPTAQTLAEGPHGPVITRVQKEGRHVIVVGFPVEASNWILKNTYPVFLYNAIRFLGTGESGGEENPLRPGDALRITLPAGAKSATVERPDGSKAEVTADASQEARYAGTQQVGLYRVSPGIPGRDRFALNLEDAGESDIRPRSTFKVGSLDVKPGELIYSATPEVWRWFVGAALMVLLLEWYIYNRRVML